MSCFDDAPEFIAEDNRRFRPRSPVTQDLMEAKHEALFPPSLVKDKTIIDFGSCTGATGHWCLSHGARHYTGVEVQETYAELSRCLLEKYHGASKFVIQQQPIEQVLADYAGKQQYDIVSFLGVLYVFVDYYSILRQVASLSRSVIAIEGMCFNGKNGYDKNFCGVHFMEEQRINMADENASVVGRGTRISPKGLMWLMADFGFYSPEGQIYPRPITDGIDLYRHNKLGVSMRYLFRFQRKQKVAKNLSQQLQDGSGAKELWQSEP